MLLHAGDYRAAREGKASLASELVKEWQHSHMHHLTARVDAGDLSTLHVLEEAGFEIIDGIQTLSLRLSDAARPASCEGLEVRAFRPADLEAVLAIARTAYVYDRFHADAALADGVADAINEEWTRNCCLGRAADHVVVAVEGGRVVGYVTCKVDRRSADDLGVCFGSIVLVATTAEEARGRGAARQATLGALEWFRRQGVGVVEVGTQLRNIPAARLYEGCGFRQAGVSLTLRKLF
jgi:RimJ/RimL family protein N-acetyltransferase